MSTYGGRSRGGRHVQVRGYGGGGGRGGGRGRGGPVAIYSRPDARTPDPDTRVTHVENALQQAAKDGLGLGGLSLNERFPRRPGYGTRGMEISLWANYVEMIPPSDLVLYRYDIAVLPSATGKKLGQIIRLLLETQEMMQFEQDVITDFRTTLVSRRRFERDELVLEVPYRTEGEEVARQNATKYRIRIQFTNVLAVAQLVEYLTSTNPNVHFEETSSMVQALNIFLNHYAKMSENLATIGSSKSFSHSSDSDRSSLGAGLTAIRGFFSSVRVATCRILVNVNVSHGAFYNTDQLDQLILEYSAAHRNSMSKLDSFLKRVKIKPTHLPERKNGAGRVIARIKTIVGLVNANDGRDLAHRPRVPRNGANAKEVEFWLDSGPQPSSASAGGGKVGGKKKGKKGEPSGLSSVDASGGRYISVYDYFLATYNLRLTKPDLPVINVGTMQNPVYLPPEICVVVPGQSSNSKLDSNQTSRMIQFAVRPPADNASSIVHEGLRTIGLSSRTNRLLENFGVSVPQGLITVPGRILSGPKIVYKNTTLGSVRFGSWNMLDIKFNTPGNLRKWSYLLVSLQGMRDAVDFDTELHPLMLNFHRSLQKVGITASTPLPGKRVFLKDSDDAQIDNALERASGALDLLLIILPDSIPPLYNRIKKAGDVTYGIHTICCVGHKLAKPQGQQQYFANVALKFNLKLGGINQLVENVHLGIINENKTMVVGIDVTHPSPGSTSNAPSVAGMVASVDRWLGQWPGVLGVQEARKEMVSDIAGMLKSRLKLWRDSGRHQEYPENILVYRDGVSEGQYSKVIEQELPQLRAACEELYPAHNRKNGHPKFTIVIVGKRHHTRFYPTKEADADRSGNPKPGTIVDRGVTEARNWDFFLQPHAAIKGTARPAHYYVVLDEIFRQRYGNNSAPYQNVTDVLQDLTHNMSYLYGRATKAVSLCPPAYYADIMCERARRYLSYVFDTPPYSVATSEGGGSQEEEPQVKDNDMRIHPKLKDTMFYI